MRSVSSHLASIQSTPKSGRLASIQSMPASKSKGGDFQSLSSGVGITRKGLLCIVGLRVEVAGVYGWPRENIANV